MGITSVEPGVVGKHKLIVMICHRKTGNNTYVLNTRIKVMSCDNGKDELSVLRMFFLASITRPSPTHLDTVDLDGNEAEALLQN